MIHELNDILIRELEGVKSWQEIKIKFEKYNTIQSEKTRKKTQAGKIFELFTKYYLLTNPNYSEYTDVWLYDEVKPSIISELRLPPTDHGIDLILKTRNNDYHAVQCKFKNDERKSLSWTGDKIANIIALGINCSRQIVFTNVSEITDVATNLSDSFEKISYYELMSTPPEVFESILQIARGFKPKPITYVKADPHQVEATKAVIDHFQNNDRGQLILPCGAGKTLVALWIKEGMRAKNTLVLVPSLALLRQIKDSWSFQRKFFYERLNVCSEKDIDKSKDTFNIHTYEVGGPVTTNPKEICDFLVKDSEKVVFSTYQSLRSISEACKLLKGFQFDLTICDEAHRTAGSKSHNEFTLVHYDKNIPSKKRLYMTATPKVASINLKSLLGKDYELLCDMGKPEIFGIEAYRLTFGAAIKQNVLVDYKIIGIGVSDEDVEKFITERHYVGSLTADKIAHNFALDLVMKEYKAFHSLTFHSRVEFAEKFAERHSEFFPSVYSSAVKGQQTTNQRVRILNEFRESEVGVVSNARCLTEGVDVPTIDLIYFSDPKNSKIDIVQASGRALRKDRSGKSKKEMGYIVVPIFHNASKNIETEIKKRPIFNHLIDVVRSLCDQDERLQSEINEAAFKEGIKTSSKIDFRFVGEEVEKIIKLENIEEKIRRALVHEIIIRNRDYWEVMYKTLLQFKDTYGHMNVSGRKSDHKQLGRWIQEQRRSFRTGKLSQQRLSKLNDIGFDWRIENRKENVDYDLVWKNNFQKLLEYYNENGNSDVPFTYKIDNTLKNWVIGQRVKYKNGKLEDWKINDLKKVKFNFAPRAKGLVQKVVEELIEYKRVHGDTLVPVFRKKGDKYWHLSGWVNKVRTIYNNGKPDGKGRITYKDRTSLLKEDIELLNGIGFVWRVTEDWNSSYNKVKEYYLKNGHSNIPQSHKSNLYNWCYKQRKNKEGLTKKEIDLLEEIEFEFRINTHKTNRHRKISFNERISQLIKFKEKHGHFNVPKGNLYNWLLGINRQLDNRSLPLDKIRALTDIDYDFNLIMAQNDNSKWEAMYDLLKKHSAKTGSTKIKAVNKKMKSLLQWTNSQKQQFRNGTLSQSRASLLNQLGIFDRNDFEKQKSVKIKNKKIKPSESERLWDENVLKLHAYYDLHGNCDIPFDFSDKDLVRFVRFLRSPDAKVKLNNHQLKLLETLGFNWNLDRNHEIWLREYSKLKDFYVENGNSLVRKSKTDEKHYSWILLQRMKNKKGMLSQLRKKLLDDIEFPWILDDVPTKGHPDHKNWNIMYEELIEFRKKYGHVRVSQNDLTYKRLGVWLNIQRVTYSRGKMLAKRIELLEEVGIIWNTKIADWESRFQQAVEFKRINGHFNIAQSDTTFPGLYFWIRHIRTRAKLTKEQKDKLDKIAFFDNVPVKKNDNFNERFNQLIEYRKLHGTFVVKKSNYSLYNWLKDIRRRPRLTRNQVNQLKEIGVDTNRIQFKSD